MAKESISRGSKLLFTTDHGKLLSSTVRAKGGHFQNFMDLTKVVKREWKGHSEGIGQVLPSLTATVCRKVAVYTLRESAEQDGSSKLPDAGQQPTLDLSPPVLEPASSDSDGHRSPSPTPREEEDNTKADLHSRQPLMQIIIVNIYLRCK
ncbi:hypothetical protein KP79_PYT18688 [Mizuhopecten yessoensis]|uniref:Uncharacterized protein n=1 Tax=Mizuhopecten yessoensis TaxID=6573 RepID=A0A210R6Q9_MIZYE|nr:hypothetical protein KP79_PYT18688 [Mizuhopecten yessoensis]